MSVEDRRKLLRVYTSGWDHRSQGGLWPPPIHSVRQAFRYNPLMCGSIRAQRGYDGRFVQLPSLSLWVPAKE